MPTLSAFTKEQSEKAKLLLATRVASMMGRKLEEGDWTSVYCRAKDLPDAGWSNLHIDVNYRGLGLELKLLRIATLGSKSLKSVCGTTLMHPALTRSIRIENDSQPAKAVMRSVFQQYADLVAARTESVRVATPGSIPDMRIGWLIWEDSLSEFLYFEEPMRAPNPRDYYAEWNVTAARGIRKSSKSLWIYEKRTNQKRYSVTTSAGIKIQPYFDVPPPGDPNLYFFRAQSETVDPDTILLWVASATARVLKQQLGSLDKQAVSNLILRVTSGDRRAVAPAPQDEDLAVPIAVSAEAHRALVAAWEAVSDEHRVQLLLKALNSN